METALLLIETELNLSILQRFAIWLAEKWCVYPVAQGRVVNVPVDIEHPGKAAVATPFEQIEPGAVVGATDGHVIGHNIDDQSHPVLAQLLHQGDQPRLAPQLRIDCAMVNHVVTMV